MYPDRWLLCCPHESYAISNMFHADYTLSHICQIILPSHAYRVGYEIQSWPMDSALANFTAFGYTFPKKNHFQP